MKDEGLFEIRMFFNNIFIKIQVNLVFSNAYLECLASFFVFLTFAHKFGILLLSKQALGEEPYLY